MATSKEVFAKRKEGALDEAYRMALELLNKPVIDEWDKKALAWCCIDLIKRDAKSGDAKQIEEYRLHLEGVDATGDEILGKQILFALSLCTESGQDLAKAKDLSKAGKHLEAAHIYRRLIADGLGPVDVHTALGWEIYKQSKLLLSESRDNAGRIKPALQEYLRLKGTSKNLNIRDHRTSPLIA